MNTYVTGSTIRQLREAKGLTQAELAGTLSVSAKTISKWETAKGLPDISLLEPLAAAPTTPPFIRHWRRSSSLPNRGALGKSGKRNC